MQFYTDNLADNYGNTIEGAEILVKLPDDTNAVLYSTDDTASTPITNPVKTGPKGLFSFYAINGHYNLTVTAPGIAQTIIEDIILFDPLDAFATPPILPTYTVATLPSAVTYARGLIYVSDETGGAVMAFSDGTNWRRCTDRVIIS